MYIEVYHAPRDLFNKINTKTCDEEKASLVRENIKTYERVLVVPFGDYNLDDFYRYTQNIDEAWTKKFGIDADYRSSSIGDVFVVDGKVFMVATFGFTQLEGVTL